MYWHEGDLQLLGRLDHQVKVAGVRVHLGEIEACLLAHPRVQAAAARTWDLHTATAAEATGALPASSSGGGGSPYWGASSRSVIVAYVVVASEGPSTSDTPPSTGGGAVLADPGDERASRPPASSPSADDAGARAGVPVRAPGAAGAELEVELRSWVGRRLPSAAVPAAVVLMAPPSLPCNPAGKVLRNLLPRPAWLASEPDPPQHSPHRHTELAAASGLLGVPRGRSRGFGAGSSLLQSPNDQGVPAAEPFPSHQRRGGTSDAPSPASELAVMLAFRRALGRSDLEPTDDFFAAGGSSLAAALAAAELGTEPALLYAAPTARRLAALLMRPSDNGGSLAGRGRSQGGLLEEASVSGLPHSQLAAEGGDPPGGAAKRRRVMVLQAAASAAAAPAASHPGIERSAEAAVVVRRDWAEALHHCDGLTTLTGAGRTSMLTFTADGDISSLYTPSSATSSMLPVLDPTFNGLGSVQQRAGSGVTRSAEAVLSEPCSEVNYVGGADCSASVAWSHPLGRCVDAAPLLVGLHRRARLEPKGHGEGPGSEDRGGSGGFGESRGAVVLLAEAVLACSHDGSVACLDTRTGTVLWQAQLPARAEVGMCISKCMVNGSGRSSAEAPAGAAPESDAAVATACVAVACGDDRLHFLGLEYGRPLGLSPPLGGALRSAPAVDPWPGCGLTWVATHGRELLAVATPSGRVIARWGPGGRLRLAPLPLSQGGRSCDEWVMETSRQGARSWGGEAQALHGPTQLYQ